MNIIICPGIHQPELTDRFIQGVFGQFSEDLSSINCRHNIIIFPTQKYPAYSAFHILQFLRDTTGETVQTIEKDSASETFFSLRVSSVPLVFISFSAGVVGAIGAAWAWQHLGGCVKAFIAIDGWGVPLYGDFPIHRISHDYFTHWSSGLLGSGEDSFYADPAVEHLDMWHKPQIIRGWWVHSEREISQPQYVTPGETARSPSTATQFLTMLLERYLRIKGKG